MLASCKKLLLIICTLSPLAVYAADDPFEYIDSSAIENNNEASYQSDSDVFNNLSINDTTYNKKVKIIALNKITANSKELVINVGDKVKFGNAELKIYSCVRRNYDQVANYNFLIELIEPKLDAGYNIIFKGWLLSNSPSISTIQHPIYQFLAINCN